MIPLSKCKTKYQDEGETDEDKMEEYKASREWDNVLVKKISPYNL